MSTTTLTTTATLDTKSATGSWNVTKYQAYISYDALEVYQKLTPQIPQFSQIKSGTISLHNCYHDQGDIGKADIKVYLGKDKDGTVATNGWLLEQDEVVPEYEHRDDRFTFSLNDTVLSYLLTTGYPVSSIFDRYVCLFENVYKKRTFTIENFILSYTYELPYFTIEANCYTGNEISNTGGTVIGIGDYDVDTTVTITAIPNKGYYFAGWTDGVTASSREVIVTSDEISTHRTYKTYEAIFKPSLIYAGSS